MTKLQYRWMHSDEIVRLADIDRSEQIRVGYIFENGKLKQLLDVNWDSPAWGTDDDGEYSVAAQIRFCQTHLERNGRMYGAFDNEKLVGIGIVQPQIGAGMAQLAFLHVSNGRRREGIGEQIINALIIEAKNTGAVQMYVSAVPSQSAVSFYRRQGFEPTNNPIPELFALEPEDIHMVKIL